VELSAKEKKRVREKPIFHIMKAYLQVSETTTANHNEPTRRIIQAFIQRVNKDASLLQIN
jgi:hypothetical protein